MLELDQLVIFVKSVQGCVDLVQLLINQDLPAIVISTEQSQGYQTELERGRHSQGPQPQQGQLQRLCPRFKLSCAIFEGEMPPLKQTFNLDFHMLQMN